ncbi:hypothetical protein Dimus_001236 [Dionaea muscipula]
MGAAALIPSLGSQLYLNSTHRLLLKNPSSSRFPNSASSSSSMVLSTSLSVKASSTIGSSKEILGAASLSGAVGKSDLLIVGPGVLGSLVAQKWREENPGCQIHGQTATVDHHDELRQIGINPSLKGTKFSQEFPYVIFCAPPYRSPDYPGDIREAALNWNGEGSFLFTSSSAPYDCDDNGFCDEDTPVVPLGRSPRTDVLLKAEKADAASLSIAILKKNLRGRTFLGCDNHPVSREEIMDLVNRSGKFSKKFTGFTGTDGPLGKRLDNSRTRAEIGWEPKYPSFAEFLQSL